MFTGTLRFLAMVLLTVILGLAGTEAVFRLSPKSSAVARDYMQSIMWRAMQETVKPRIEKHWSRTFAEKLRKDEYFFPPHVAYFNKDQNNLERLKEAAQRTKFPANRQWHTANFLRSELEAEDSRFTVTTNSLGFRDFERQVIKAPGTFRILLLGSYPAFGHGVNDEETYARRIEAILNEKHINGLRYEVWNAGRQGSTAFQGLALLQTEIFKYSPDLILWDYGWVDLYCRKDSLPDAYLGQERPLSITERAIQYFCGSDQVEGVFSQSLTCARLYREMSRRNSSKYLSGWRETNREMLQLTREHNVPVVMIRHEGVAIPAQEFERLIANNDHAYFVDTSAAISAAKLTEAEKEKFWAKRTWVDELGIKRDEADENPEVLLRGDAIHYNAMGYRRIGDLISTRLEAILWTEKRTSASLFK
jgi:hypothetical protein